MNGLTDKLKNTTSDVDLPYSHFEYAVTILLQCFLDVPKGKIQGDSSLVNDVAKIFVPAFISTVQCMQSQGNF
jgi:hypothetical protein